MIGVSLFRVRNNWLGISQPYPTGGFKAAQFAGCSSQARRRLHVQSALQNLPAQTAPVPASSTAAEAFLEDGHWEVPARPETRFRPSSGAPSVPGAWPACAFVRFPVCAGARQRQPQHLGVGTQHAWTHRVHAAWPCCGSWSALMLPCPWGSRDCCSSSTRAKQQGPTQQRINGGAFLCVGLARTALTPRGRLALRRYAGAAGKAGRAAAAGPARRQGRRAQRGTRGGRVARLHRHGAGVHCVVLARGPGGRPLAAVG